MGRKPFQFPMRVAMVLSTVVAVMISIAIVVNRPRDSGHLLAAIEEADRIVVRDTWEIMRGQPKTDSLLFEVRGRKKTHDINRHIAFVANQSFGECDCVGTQTIEWYRGAKLLTSANLAHGSSIKWEKVDYDLALTEQSGKWMVKWMIDNGVSPDSLD